MDVNISFEVLVSFAETNTVTWNELGEDSVQINMKINITQLKACVIIEK